MYYKVELPLEVTIRELRSLVVTTLYEVISRRYKIVDAFFDDTIPPRLVVFAETKPNIKPSELVLFIKHLIYRRFKEFFKEGELKWVHGEFYSVETIDQETLSKVSKEMFSKMLKKGSLDNNRTNYDQN